MLPHLLQQQSLLLAIIFINLSLAQLRLHDNCRNFRGGDKRAIIQDAFNNRATALNNANQQILLTLDRQRRRYLDRGDSWRVSRTLAALGIRPALPNGMANPKWNQLIGGLIGRYHLVFTQ